MRGYQAVKGDKDWCIQNFINARAVKNAMEIRTQLESFCENLGIPPNASSGNEVEPILQCFVQGFFQNLAVLQVDGSYQTFNGKQICHIHPSSVLFGKRMSLILFHELVQTSRQYMRSVSSISLAWLQGTGSHYFTHGQGSEQ
ncbi:putative ATP-dependent RNA helicase dhx33 [Rhizoclosmatium hyalinum]|nr:putative ATP-dependent RNA helicase dhx33 [Rhizoclosmatium hyalinum]